MKLLGERGLSMMTKALKEEALRQIKLGFRQSRDPYGNPWKKLQFRKGQPLRATGRMQNSFTAVGQGEGVFVVGTNVMYAGTHQEGKVIVPKTKQFLAFRVPTYARGGKGAKNGERWVFAKKVTIPKRQMVPEKDWGPIWTKAFSETETSVLTKILKNNMPPGSSITIGGG